MYENFGISKKIEELSKEVEKEIQPIFNNINEITECFTIAPSLGEVNPLIYKVIEW